MNPALTTFAAVAMQGLLANSQVINRETLLLEVEGEESPTLKAIAFRALQAAIYLQEELEAFEQEMSSQ